MEIEMEMWGVDTTNKRNMGHPNESKSCPDTAVDGANPNATSCRPAKKEKAPALRTLCFVLPPLRPGVRTEYPTPHPGKPLPRTPPPTGIRSG